jgi:hypothetical protein
MIRAFEVFGAAAAWSLVVWTGTTDGAARTNAAIALENHRLTRHCGPCRSASTRLSPHREIPMRTLCVLLLALPLLMNAQDRPIAGQSCTLRYDPRTSGILVHEKALTLVYVFNVWTVHVTSSRAPGMLMFQVTHPDPDKVRTVQMVRTGRTWTATIDIPKNASLLSYYLRGTDTSDFNGNRTYVSYVYRRDGMPVSDARFRNIAFMNDAGASTSDQIAEISRELNDYPDNFIAYIPYWLLRFDTTRSTESLRMLGKEAGEQFDGLEKKLGPTDTLLNVRAGVVFRYGLRIGSADPASAEAAGKEFDRIVERIEPAKRFRYIQEICSERRLAAALVWRHRLLTYGVLVFVLACAAFLVVWLGPRMGWLAKR